MKTTDFSQSISSTRLSENLEKQFGVRVNLNKYDREQLEDIRNKLRTRVFQQEASAGVNDLLTNEDYQKDKAMLELLNIRIKEMLGEDIKKLRDKMDELSEGKKGVRQVKHSRPAKGGDDKTGDGKKDFDDVQVARMTAGGVPKKKAIAKATSDNFKEAVVKGKPGKYGKDNDQAHGEPDHPAKDATDTPAPKFDSSELQAASGSKMPKNPVKGKTVKFKEAKECSKGHTKMTKGCKECAGMYEALKGKQGNLDADKDGKLEKSDFAALRAKKKVKESFNQFKHNVRFVNESVNFLLQEDEEGKAKTITAAGDMVNDFTSWMQRVGQYQTKAIIELSDEIRSEFGPAEAEAFKQTVGPALSATLETLTQQREAISNAVAQLATGAAPQQGMGMEPEMPAEPGMDMAPPDEMNPAPAGDEFAAADAAAGGPEASGREMRESKFARRLQESHNIIAKLSV